MKLSIIILILLISLGCQPTASIEEEANTMSLNWAFPHFEKVDSINPILKPSAELIFSDPITKHEIKWEERNVLNPSAVVKDNKIYLLYRAQDYNGSSRIGMAISTDGLHFDKMETPVFYPDNDDMKVYEWNTMKEENNPIRPKCISCLFNGIEDPRIIESENGIYFMTYTSYDGATARLSIASSKDLLTWEKHGLVLSEDKYRDLWSKSGAIVCEQEGSKMIAKKINDKYWMYFGDTELFMATSTDLLTWKVLEDSESGKMISVLQPRKGFFDSRLVEPGPYAIYKKEGILLIYNSSNAANFNDENLPKYTYSAAQALFDKGQPYKMIDRTDSYFITPDKEYEKVGEVNEVCFVEGLVFFQQQWFLYYGTADSKIAVAVYNPAVQK